MENKPQNALKVSARYFELKLLQNEKQRGEKYKQKSRRCHQERSYCKIDVEFIKP